MPRAPIPAADTFTPPDLISTGAECGFACHTSVASQDYIFTGDRSCVDPSVKCAEPHVASGTSRRQLATGICPLLDPLADSQAAFDALRKA